MSKYLELHERLLKIGLSNGLCNVEELQNDELFDLMRPCDGWSNAFWAYSEGCTETVKDWEKEWDRNQDDFIRKYTPLRQNIVLLMAAMNGEL